MPPGVSRLKPASSASSCAAVSVPPLLSAWETTVLAATSAVRASPKSGSKKVIEPVAATGSASTPPGLSTDSTIPPVDTPPVSTEAILPVSSLMAAPAVPLPEPDVSPSRLNVCSPSPAIEAPLESSNCPPEPVGVCGATESVLPGPAATLKPLVSSAATSTSCGTSMSPMTKVGTFSAPPMIRICEPSGWISSRSSPSSWMSSMLALAASVTRFSASGTMMLIPGVPPEASPPDVVPEPVSA